MERSERNKTKRRGRRKKEEEGGEEEQKEEQKLVCKVTIDGRSDTFALVFALDHRSTRKEMTRDSNLFRFVGKENFPSYPNVQLFFDVVGTVQSLVGVYNG